MEANRGTKQQAPAGGLDLFRLIAAFLVVAIHTSPLESVSAEADFFLTRIVARVAVPFFFMVTGQFVLTPYMREQDAKTGRERARIWRYVRKLLLLYGAAILLYLPVGIYAGHYRDLTLSSAVRMLVFDGTFYHLWYFPSLLVGMLLLLLMRRFCTVRVTGVIVALLYVLGLLGDSYWGLTRQLPGVGTAYEWCFQELFSYSRNGLFFAPLFLWMGAQSDQDYGQASSRKGSVAGLCVALLLLTMEGFVLRDFELQRHDSMYLLLPAVMFFLYQLLLAFNSKAPKGLRKISTWIYLLHPAVIVALRGVVGAFPSAKILLQNSILFYLLVAVCSALASLLVVFLLSRIPKKEKKPARQAPEQFAKGRAWIELNRDALRQNIAQLQALLPEDCRLMPAVKANAYGHGALMMARALNQMGIDAFCVACVAEGIALRQGGVQGEILVLGFTHPKQFSQLHRYDLTQTVVDYPYAQLLNRDQRKLKVHVAIDTGMRRLGERSDHIEQLLRISRMKNLQITGAFTHLCADDSSDLKAQEFTRRQAQAFFQVVEAWKKHGFTCPRVHLLASYGVLNYPELAGDYARVGIALYGVRSAWEDYDRFGLSLQPVLSLKARVASVRELCPGEPAGYGLAFTAERPMKIAALAIGYGDGLPRALSDQAGAVLIRGKRAAIIGRICMDQTLVDVTDIEEVRGGDVAVLIGRSGQEELTVYEMAARCHTITNEILSRLGNRLERIWEPEGTSLRIS